MSTQVQRAVLLDHHSSSSSSSSSHPPSTFNLINLVKTNLQDGLLTDHISSDVTQLYILTSSTSDVNNASDQSDFREDQLHVSVVGADDRIASFYRAKQKLDSLEVSQVTVLCEARAEQFWTYVCQDMFTPVHQWEVKVVKLSVHNKTASINNPDQTDDFKRHGQPTSSNRQHLKTEPSKRNDLTEESSRFDHFTTDPSLPQPSIYDDLDIGSTPRDNLTSTSSNTDDIIVGKNSQVTYRDAELESCSAESVRAQIRGFLKTLPSLLGLPEVERSQLLPGAREGFVHGYSTRRGGVTSLPTLCAMNLMYTDKKREPPLVIEENCRRLSLVGGFDPQTFHIVRVEHGHRVWTVGEEEPPVKYDALVTNRRDVTISAAGADCIPLLFADPVAMVIGAAHAGWLGSVKRVAESVVKTMGERFGSKPENIRVSMGPGLRLGCFKVLEEEGKMFSDIHPSCQADSVEPVCHKIDKLNFQEEEEEDSRGCDMPGKYLLRDDEDQVLQVPETLAGEERNTEHWEDCTHTKQSPAPLLHTRSLKNEKRTSSGSKIEDGKTSPSTTSSKHLLKQLRVEKVPAENLKPKMPRERKNSSLQWTFVDLQLTNYHVLLQAGVKADHIDVSTSHCTKCNPDLYFSYERDGFPFGNQIGFICMPSRASE